MSADTIADKKPKKARRKLKIALAIVIPFVVLFIILPIILYAVLADDTTLDFEKFTITVSRDNASETAAVAGSVKIVHLSDTHFPDIFVDLDKLVERITQEQPDFIAITGDIVPTRGDIATSGLAEFLEKITPTAPVFYVDGNHDRANRNMAELHTVIRNSGAIILCRENSSYNLIVRGKQILIVGLEYGQSSVVVTSGANANSACAIVFLKHVPSFNVPIYYNAAAGELQQLTPDLILAGHIHGGHVRLFNRAILCPDTLLFPRYSNGLYNSQTSSAQMIVSRGIGNSVLAGRLFNNPHVPIIQLGISLS